MFYSQSWDTYSALVQRSFRPKAAALKGIWAYNQYYQLIQVNKRKKRKKKQCRQIQTPYAFGNASKCI
jgi:hypothetical protein